MPVSTFQKVALVSCLVLCVSLILPKMFLSRGKKEAAQQEGGAGRFPAMVRQQKTSSGGSRWSASSPFPKSHHGEAIAKTKTKGGNGAGGSNRQSLLGQLIPIYGFGILLYILYILFKISSKDKNPKVEKKFPPIRTGSMKRKITDYELAQLQEKLKETEEAMEKIVSRVGQNSEKIRDITTEQEEKLLQQLKEITRVMKEGKLIDGISPEQEAEEAPYMEDWEGYPEETYPVYDEECCHRRHHDTIHVDCSELNQPSPEEIAEKMEDMEIMEEEICCCFGTETPKGDINKKEETQVAGQNKDRQIKFSDQRSVFLSTDDKKGWQHCLHSEDEDPAVIAENVGFCYESYSEEEIQEEPNADLKDTEDESADRDRAGILRKRNQKRPE
ncbi:protein RIC-3 [Latimeria chalumnae]|uniref:protein RIC-3 n=1 Tax=Latimeria chalumnae TaxID=7897 RepID=UPI00313F2FC4